MATCIPFLKYLLLYFCLFFDVFVVWIVCSGDGFYFDGGLGQTLIYRGLPKRERREVQQEILHLLGLEHRPKPKVHETDSSAPKFLLDLYKSLLEGGELKDEGVALARKAGLLENNVLAAVNDSDVIMSFVNHAHHKPHLRHDRDRHFWFDVSEVRLDEQMMGAELHLFRDSKKDKMGAEAHHYTLTLYVLMEGDRPEEKKVRYVDSLNITKDQNGWLIFNVTDPLITWVVFPQDNLGLYLNIQTDGVDRDMHPEEIGILGSKSQQEQQPFMVAFFKTPTNVQVRKPRAAGKKKQQRSDVTFYDHDDRNPYIDLFDLKSIQKRSCQKKTLYVSFKDLGWEDWIIAPDGYAAFYCQGECSFPLNAHMNATNHAIVQTLVHLMNPFMVPKPCCAPTKLTAIMVLYFDDNSNVILKKYKNMVVKSCGCH